MKNKLSLLFIITISVLFAACDENESAIETEKVQFALTSAVHEDTGGRLNGTLPDNVKLSISISNPSGKILLNKVVNILVFGDSYITEPLELPVGRYSITDFFIVSTTNEILFATPKQGSMLAEAVRRPLPFSFALGKGKVKPIEMQVIDVAKHSAKAFGYTAFNIEVVNPLPIAVFTEQSDVLTHTSAMGFIYESGSDLLIQEFSIGAKINYISFTGDLDKEYRLVIRKDGYVQFKKIFTYNALMEELDDESLKIILEPVPLSDSFTFRNYTSSGTFTFDLIFTGAGSVSVDWGDGNSEVISFTTESLTQQIGHEYFSEGQFNVVISGDLDKVTSFTDNLGFIYEMDLAGLPNLSSLILQEGELLVLDVSRAYHLENLTLRSMDVGDIILENNPYLKTLVLDEVYTLIADTAISKFHANVVDQVLFGGTISTTGIFPELSNASHSLIYDLRDNYDLLWLNDEHG